jgi:hypothetical protein
MLATTPTLPTDMDIDGGRDFTGLGIIKALMLPFRARKPEHVDCSVIPLRT